MMIRLLVVSVMVLMAGNAHASYKNKELYPSCKTLEMNNFFPANKAHFACFSYFSGVADAGQFLCGEFMEMQNPNDLMRYMKETYGIAFGTYNRDTAIRDYLRLVEENQWAYTDPALLLVNQALQKQLPCE